MFDDNQYIEQPNNAAQPSNDGGSSFTQESPVQQAAPAPDPAPAGMDDPQAMDDLAKSLEDLSSPADAPGTDQPAKDEAPAEVDALPEETPQPAAEGPAAPSDDSVAIDPELADIKQRALMELSPLVDKLEQTPPEKFKTVMMLIQASDNQALVSAAYEAANGIEDEAARARALLDVVNEINYFTSKDADQQ